MSAHTDPRGKWTKREEWTKQTSAVREECMQAAAVQSALGDPRFVVYVPDNGYDIYNSLQCEKYAPLIFIEATFIAGKKVADVREIGETLVRT